MSPTPSHRTRLEQLVCPFPEPEVTSAGLALDPRRPCDLAFISHAHGDHVSGSRQVIASRTTARLVRERFGNPGTEWIERGYGETFFLPGHRLELLPAGHAPGSAQLWIEREDDGLSLLYTGDFKRRTNPVAVACEARRASVLLMETTFGLPTYRFPPLEETLERLRDWITAVQADDGVPILLAYSFGKAQELVAHLSGDFQVLAHATVARMNRSCEKLGLQLGSWRRFGQDTDPRGAVIIAPPNAARSVALRRIPGRQLAICSGWALAPGWQYRYQGVDAAFPLSDHADYEELLAHVEAVDPELVLCTHGFTREFAADLRRRGRDAWVLGEAEQLELGESGMAPGWRPEREHPTSPESDRNPVADGETSSAAASVPCADWASLARLAARIGAEASQSAKVELLASWLATVDSAEAARACGWLGGECHPGGRALGLGWAALKRALVRLGVDRSQLAATSRELGDSAATTRTLIAALPAPQGTSPTLAEGDRWAEAWLASGDPRKREAMLADWLGRLGAVEAGTFVGCLLGSLRRGLSRGLIEEAIGRAAQLQAPALRRARLLAGSLRRLAAEALAGRAEALELEPGSPLEPMLAAVPVTARQIREEGRSASATIWEELACADRVWLEPKYDGIRAQLHVQASSARLFSRDLRALDEEFPELIEEASQLPEVILDGEIIASGGFSALQRRLGRKNAAREVAMGDLFAPEDKPALRFIAFDCLWAGGEALWHRPLQERRARLEGILSRCQSGWLEVIQRFEADSAMAIEARFQLIRRAGGEGLIAKDPTRPYDAGRRGRAWLKLKQPSATLTCVVVKAQQGHGKRNHLLSDYTFALRDGGSEAVPRLKVLGKAYSGLRDEEIEELTEWFEAHTVSQRGRVRTVLPEIVLEIAFDSIQESDRWNSGLSLRFPRIARWRRDLTIRDIDSVEHARALAGLSMINR